MNRTATLLRWVAGLVALTTTGSGTLALAKNPPDAEKSAWAITLIVYDYAHLNRSSMLAAEGEATRIFARAGVDARWVDCPTAHADQDNFPNCQSEWQANNYILRVMPTAMVATLGESQDSLGCTLVCNTGEGVMASVFYNRINELSGGPHAPVPVLLGRAMAHEIGHLLLGPNAHSRTGIMRAQWSDHDFTMEARIELFFTAEQSRRMKTRLAEQAQTWQAQAKAVELGR